MHGERETRRHPPVRRSEPLTADHDWRTRSWGNSSQANVSAERRLLVHSSGETLERQRRHWFLEPRSLEPRVEETRVNMAEVSMRSRESSVHTPSSSRSSDDVVNRYTAEDGDGGDEEAAEGLKRKRHKILHDLDRRKILRRIDAGEKQVDLAKEYGVTRATICHIKKRRDEILVRCDTMMSALSDSDVAEVKKISANSQAPRPPLPLVRELCSSSILLLLTALRDATTPPPSFRAAADRLIMILLEKVIAGGVTTVCTVQTPSGRMIDGIRARPFTCVAAIGSKGAPLLEVYHRRIDPNMAIASINLSQRCDRVDGRASDRISVESIDSSVHLAAESSVLLVISTTATGRSACAALRALTKMGVQAKNIQLATLACTDTAVKVIHDRYDVRITTCAVDVVRSGRSKATSIEDFLQRYNATAAATETQ